MKREDFLKMFKNQKYTEKLMEIPQKFNVVHNEEEKLTEITIYGVIGDSWWDSSFSANDIDKALNEAGDNDVLVNLNSPGGDAFDGIAIFNRLKRHKGKVTIHVDGWACSAASVIAMAGDEVTMELGSMMMIHEASNIVWGTKTDMRKEADILEELEEGIIDIYQIKSNLEREDIRNKVDEETWMSASKAVEYGFADKATGKKEDESEDKEDITITNNTDKKKVLDDLKKVLEEDKNNKFNLLKSI